MKILVLLAVASALVSAASGDGHVKDVMPIPGTTNIWGLMPYPDVTVTAGTNLLFRTPAGFHDVALVSTREAMDNCDVSTFELVMGTDGVLAPEFESDGNNVTVVDGWLNVFNWRADTPGTYYIVCTIAGGAHCLAGQKFQLTVEDGSSTETVTVTGEETPFWTVAVGYPDMNISLGDSLRFVSDNQGYHDVVLLNSTCGAATDFDCCSPNTIADHTAEVLYSTEDFKSETTYIWTPEEAGTYDIVCTVSLHCQFGQKFTVTVSGTSGDGQQDSGASHATLAVSALLGMAVLLVMGF